MRHIIFLLTFGFLMAAMPAASFAQSEHTPIPGAGNIYCPHLSQTMVRGARDRATVPPGQVTELQHFLSDYYDIDPDDIMTGYFGVLTHRSVVRFQQEQGLPAFGIVGPMTRAAIAKVCGPLSGNPTQGQPTFTATPTSETSHSLTATFTIGNLNSTTANQQFTIAFGDGTSGTVNGPGCSTTNSIPGSVTCGTTANISHTYTASGTYTATLSGPCAVKFSGCIGPVLGTTTITVGSIISATACTFNGQIIANGESVLAYTSPTAPGTQQCVSERRTCVKGVLTGSYKNTSCVEQPCNNNTVGCGPILPLTPTISFTTKQTRVAPGTRTALVWSTTNATWCSAGGGWNGTKATSGTEETPVLWGATTFTLTCFGPGYQTPTTKSVTVSVIPEEPPVPTFSATPTSGVAPLSVSFTGLGLTGGSQYIIDYGDGSNSGPIQSHCLSNQPYPGYNGPAMTCSSVDASHVYPAAGTYTATLQGYVACLWSNPRCEIATIPLGTATITVTGTGTPGVTFSATPTSETSHSLTATFTIGNLNSTTANQQFTIAFGDGTSGTVNGPGCSTTNSIPGSVTCGTTANISHTYTASGTYTATLSGPCTVKFAGCSGPVLGTATVTVGNSLPLTDANCMPSLTSDSVFSVQVTSPTIATVSFRSTSYWQWTGFDFGDGTKIDQVWGSPSVRAFSDSNVSCTRHTYANPGTYLIRQTSNGVPLSCGSQTCKTVTVQ